MRRAIEKNAHKNLLKNLDDFPKLKLLGSESLELVIS